MNSEMLLKIIKDKKKPIGEICESLNVSRSAFYRKCRGITEFTLGEVEKLCEELELESPIEVFFGAGVS